MRLQNIADLLRWVVKLQPCFLDDPFNAVGCLLLRKQSRDFFAVLLRMLLEYHRVQEQVDRMSPSQG